MKGTCTNLFGQAPIQLVIDISWSQHFSQTTWYLAWYNTSLPDLVLCRDQMDWAKELNLLIYRVLAVLVFGHALRWLISLSQIRSLCCSRRTKFRELSSLLA